VHARDWVTWHGFALNVTTDLSYFDLMVPCGIAAVQMTSIEREVGVAGTLGARARLEVASRLAEVFSLETVAIAPAEIQGHCPEGSLSS
jgi:lipoyl(octanoyl) transferase